MEAPNIDFMIARENCIEIHSTVSKIFGLCAHIGQPIKLPEPFEDIRSGDDTLTHHISKNWTGMALLAKVMLQPDFWSQLPKVRVSYYLTGIGRMGWNSTKEYTELESAYLSLGGERAASYAQEKLKAI